MRLYLELFMKKRIIASWWLRCIQPRRGDTHEGNLRRRRRYIKYTFHKKQIACAEDHEGVIINYDSDGKPTEIEILNASKFMGDLLSTMFKAKTEEKQLEITA